MRYRAGESRPRKEVEVNRCYDFLRFCDLVRKSGLRIGF
nr:MAG TPA: hypothetical protein [Caudoviricetes sp.]